LRTAGLSARASHAWPEAGVYSVRVKATDSSEESPWSAAKRVTIKKDPSQRVSQLIEKLSQELSRKRADLLRSAKGLEEA
jgi:FAD synthase